MAVSKAAGLTSLVAKWVGSRSRTRTSVVATSTRAFAAAVLAVLACTAIPAAPAQAAAEDCAATVQLFRKAGQSAKFFGKSYGYAVFPTIGKAGLGVGGAYGKGCVYAGGRQTGEASMTQLSLGFQAGGQAYSQIVFFRDKRAYDEFTSGNFEFGAGVGAIAVTAAASAQVGTSGASAGASVTEKDAVADGDWVKGMVVFTIAKGGLMYEASIAGQKFKFKGK
jgi:lipid-binding SYLF domain-containing protein